MKNKNPNNINQLSIHTFSHSNKINFKRTKSAFTLVEMLIVILLIGIITGAAVIKTQDNYTRGVIVIKKIMSNDLNKYIQKNYVSGFYLDEAYVQSIVPNNTDYEDHYDSIATLLTALHEGRSNATDEFTNYIPPLTKNSYENLMENLNSSRFRGEYEDTGHFLLVGDEHSNIEIVYVPPVL